MKQQAVSSFTQWQLWQVKPLSSEGNYANAVGTEPDDCTIVRLRQVFFLLPADLMRGNGRDFLQLIDSCRWLAVSCFRFDTDVCSH